MNDSSETVATARTILEAVVDGQGEFVIDDNELIPVLKRVVEGMASRMASLQVDPSDIREAREEAWEAARQAYVRLWIRQSHEIEEGPVDEEAERRDALRAFALAERGER